MPTPRFWEIESEEDIQRLREELVYPLIVKPKISHLFQQKFKCKYLLAEDFSQLIEKYRQAEAASINVLLV